MNYINSHIFMPFFRFDGNFEKELHPFENVSTRFPFLERNGPLLAKYEARIKPDPRKGVLFVLRPNSSFRTVFQYGRPSRETDKRHVQGNHFRIPHP